MTTYPLPVFQKNTFIPLIQLSICLTLLSICRATSYFNFNLNSDTLDPTTTGFTITGSAANDWLGTSASSAGDIDNDGYDDIIVGANGEFGTIGAAYVIYGGQASSFLNVNLGSVTLDPTTTGFMIIGNAVGDKFGYAVSTAGDIDKDGYDDIIVGALKSDFQGAAYVIYGGPRASRSNIDLRTETLAPLTTGFKITGNTAGDYFAYRVSTAGDINKDGHSDIIIGAYKKNGGQGMVYVIYGGSRSSMSNLDFSVNPTLLNPLTTGFRITGNAANDYFGWQATTAGDINKDGYADIIVGAYNKNSNEGAAYVIYGGPKASLPHLDLSSVNLNPATNGFKVTGNTGEQLGSAVSTAGDINNDGYDDIIIGAVRKNSYSGAVYVLYGGPKASLPNLDLGSVILSPTTNGFLVTESATSAYFGWQVSPAGDVNKDGYADIIASSYKKNSEQGAVYVIYGGLKSSMANIDLSTSLDSTNRGFMITGDVAGDQFGYSLSTADINNDGYGDIIIGAPQKNSNQGTVYVIHSAHCSPNCIECSSATSCAQCANSYLSYQFKCFSICPDTTFTSTPTCQDCLLNCNQCTDAISCTKCVDPYLLHLSQCLPACPPTTYASAGQCKNCPTNCDQCSDSISCTQCTSPFLLYRSQCVSTCPISTFTSPGKCEDCPANCYACTSQTSCEICQQGYTLSTTNSLCVSLSYQKSQEKASQAISSATQALGGVVCVGSATFPVTALVSTIVQNTRYLNLSVSTDLSEIYKTWNTDLISWDAPNVFSGRGQFKSAPLMFARYQLDSPFLANIWPTLLNIGIGLAIFITCYVLKNLFERSEYNKGWAFSLVQKLIMGSFNFTLIQTYACLDNILFYLVIDVKTNPFNSFFSWASVISAGVFLALGCLLIFFNFWTVKKYQDIKNQGPTKETSKALEAFNERNKYWGLFYSDFNDNDLLGQSFFAFLIMRSTLSSLITSVLYEIPLMQISFLIVLDGAIIIFLISKKPFNTIEATLCQYYFEVIALLVHLCTFILALQDSLETSSDGLRTVLSTGIIYLNTALISGSIGFMFVEICKTIRHKIKAHELKHSQTISVPEENKETQNLTDSPFQHSEPNALKQEDWLNHEQDPLPVPENLRFFSGIHPNPDNTSSIMRINMEPSQSLYEDNSVFPDVNTSHIIHQPRNLNAQPIMVRGRPEIMKAQRRNRSVFSNSYFNNEQLINL